MKKLLVVAAVLAVLATACGDSAEEPDLPATSGGDELLPVANPSTAPPAEASSSNADPGDDTVPADDDDALEVELVDPNIGEEKAVQPAPPPPVGDGAVPPPVVDHPNPQVATAIADLVGRIGVEVPEVELVSIEEVTWPDGSVGCPLPGMRYTQALVNGTRIILQANGIQYQYNSGGGREPFYCANPSDPVPGEGDYGDL